MRNTTSTVTSTGIFPASPTTPAHQTAKPKMQMAKSGSSLYVTSKKTKNSHLITDTPWNIGRTIPVFADQITVQVTSFELKIERA